MISEIDSIFKTDLLIQTDPENKKRTYKINKLMTKLAFSFINIAIVEELQGKNVEALEALKDSYWIG